MCEPTKHVIASEAERNGAERSNLLKKKVPRILYCIFGFGEKETNDERTSFVVPRSETKQSAE